MINKNRTQMKIYELNHIAAKLISNNEGEEAIKKCYELADLDVPSALIEVGVIYEKGMGGLEVNHDLAYKHYEKAFKTGAEEAILYLARCYIDGIGCDRDYSYARHLLITAINHGVNLPNAYYGLGVIHYHGFGIDKNQTLALSEFQKAWENGHVYAGKYIVNIYKYNKKYIKALIMRMRLFIRTINIVRKDSKSELLLRPL
jgi:TPR repeat protein